MLSPEEIKALAHKPSRINALKDVCSGVVHIVGSGPSALPFIDPPEDDWVIACNGMVKHVSADIWIAVETSMYTFPWAYGNENFKGYVVWEKQCSRGGNYLSAYPDEFLQRVIWVNRAPVTRENWDIRDYGKGLAYLSTPELCGEPKGSILLHAMHLAMIMGASEIHTYGAELMFPNGEQHCYGDKPYAGEGSFTDPARFTGTVRFDIMPDGEPVQATDGLHTSTPYFLESAKAINHLMNGQDIKWVDHSNGLLKAGKYAETTISV